jgi:hypothetical protein
VLEVVAADGPELVQEFGWLSRPREPEAWAVERGLLFAVAWNVFEMPAEIALALRGPGYRAPFTAPPPPPATAAVTDDTVLDAARAAAAGALTAVDQVLSFCARGGVRTVKAGGIGTREVRRAAKALRLSDGDAAFWFWLCWRAGLLADDGGAAVLLAWANDHAGALRRQWVIDGARSHGSA